MLTNFFVNEASSFSSLAEKGNFHTSEPVLRLFRQKYSKQEILSPLEKWEYFWALFLGQCQSWVLKLYLICQNRYVCKWVFYLKVFIFTKPVYCLLILLFELIKLSLEINFKELSLVSWENQAQALHIFIF